MAGPQVAAGEAAENGRPAAVRALSLERMEYLFDVIRHGDQRTRLPSSYQNQRVQSSRRESSLRRKSFSGRELQFLLASSLAALTPD
jgi:hypothetical protein